MAIETSGPPMAIKHPDLSSRLPKNEWIGVREALEAKVSRPPDVSD